MIVSEIRAGVRGDRSSASKDLHGLRSRAKPAEAVSLSAPAEELMFRTHTLHAGHPGTRSTGDEYRFLMRLDGGVHYRFLTGPAATLERSPSVGYGDRLYGVAAWRENADGIEVTDPAWPGSFVPRGWQRELLRRSDGVKTLRDVLDDLRIPTDRRVSALEEARDLVDQGILCPGSAAGPSSGSNASPWKDR